MFGSTEAGRRETVDASPSGEMRVACVRPAIICKKQSGNVQPPPRNGTSPGQKLFSSTDVHVYSDYKTDNGVEQVNLPGKTYAKRTRFKPAQPTLPRR
jgi:hypothetical protein